MKPFSIFHLISVSTSKPATPHGKIRGEFGHYNGDIGYYLGGGGGGGVSKEICGTVRLPV